MPTKNLVSDFGGVGDAQRQTVNITVTSASSTLTVGTGIFVSGDVGKMISIWNGGNFKNATISGFTSSTVVTLNSAVGFDATASSSDILWGTDNLSAFVGASGSWRAYARTQTNPADPPILQVPDGFYAAKFSANTGGGINDGVLNNSTIQSVSGIAANCKIATFNNGEIRFGGDPAIAPLGLYNGGNSVRLQTASANSSTVTLTNPSGLDKNSATYGSRVVVGRVCLLAAFDMQGLNDSDYGYPPNSFFFEWNVISAYNSGTGVVTLQNPLTQAYKSTYPKWGPDDTSFAAGHTQGSDQGGPFTMWVAPDGYNNTVTLENFTLDSPHNQSAAHIRYLVCNGLVMSGPGLYPTQNDIVTMNSCNYPQQLEVDKMTNQVTWNNCTINKLQQQSASPNKMYINGGSIQILETAKYTEANNVAFTGTAQLTVGVTSFGRTDRVVLNSCTGIATIARGGVSTDDLGGSSGVGSQANASSFFTFTGGVIKFLKTINDGTGGTGNSGQQNLTRGFMPGTWVTFDDKYIDQVTDVYEDGTYCYIQFANTTNWPFTPVARLKVHPCPDISVTNCTGASRYVESLNAAPRRSPFYSYFKQTYVADATGTTPKPSFSVLGRLVSGKYTVSTAYTGALTFKVSQFDNWSTQKTDYSNYALGSTINMQTTGLRTLVAASSPTGTVAGDSVPDLTSIGQLWIGGGSVSNLPIFSANVSNGETPTIVVEFTMDQGIPPAVPTAVAPLRLRLRA